MKIKCRCGSFATGRCAMKIGPCPQCPESDGGQSRCRPSRWAISGRPVAVNAPSGRQPIAQPADRVLAIKCLEGHFSSGWRKSCSINLGYSKLAFVRTQVTVRIQAAELVPEQRDRQGARPENGGEIARYTPLLSVFLRFRQGASVIVAAAQQFFEFPPKRKSIRSQRLPPAPNSI